MLNRAMYEVGISVIKKISTCKLLLIQKFISVVPVVFGESIVPFKSRKPPFEGSGVDS